MDAPTATWYVRGTYDAPAPYHMWHAVEYLTSTAYTQCGLRFACPDDSNTFANADRVALTGGDRCPTCNVPEMVV